VSTSKQCFVIVRGW